MRQSRIGAAIASAALVASVGGAAVTAEAASTSSAAAGPVAVSISSTRMITMPATVQPGVNEFVVTSAKPSGFQVMTLAEGYTKEEAEADVKKGLDGGKMSALRRFEANSTFIGGVASLPDKPTRFWVDLAPGDYVALDTRAKTDVDKWISFTAVGEETGAAVPAAATIKAVRATKWSNKPKSISNKGILTFKNRASENHFVILAKMRKGATLKQVKMFLQTEEGRPPVDFRHTIDSAVIDPGQTVSFEYKLPRGNYAMLCFWPDASMGGMPHAFMGMVRTIKLK